MSVGPGLRRAAWEKLGRLIAPDPGVPWMATHTGASFAVDTPAPGVVDVYVTGRDTANRSLIGVVRVGLRNGAPEVLDVAAEPSLDCGSLGAFDENGVSYPCLVRRGSELRLYYTGWMPTVLTPFQNHVGLAVQDAEGRFRRVSRAPILERTDDDYLSTGSVFVRVENGRWRMWYTSFRRWDGPAGERPQHRYLIKHATSADGIHWERNDHVCIDFAGPDEHSICRPSVIRDGRRFHMWYCSRGDRYRIGYATSDDGVTWTRRDDETGLPLSPDGWDSQAQCYPHVFPFGDHLYMLYCGNDYGRGGLGLARLPRASLTAG